MEPTSHEVLQAALRLPKEDRARIADALYESLPAEDEVFSAEFKAELERRYQEAIRGEVELIPWSQLRDEK
jgi:putative addiction module component (TIGR02574 family)